MLHLVPPHGRHIKQQNLSIVNHFSSRKPQPPSFIQPPKTSNKEETQTKTSLGALWLPSSILEKPTSILPVSNFAKGLGDLLKYNLNPLALATGWRPQWILDKGWIVLTGPLKPASCVTIKHTMEIMSLVRQKTQTTLRREASSGPRSCTSWCHNLSSLKTAPKKNGSKASFFQDNYNNPRFSIKYDIKGYTEKIFLKCCQVNKNTQRKTLKLKACEETGLSIVFCSEPIRPLKPSVLVLSGCYHRHVSGYQALRRGPSCQCTTVMELFPQQDFPGSTIAFRKYVKMKLYRWTFYAILWRYVCPCYLHKP